MRQTVAAAFLCAGCSVAIVLAVTGPISLDRSAMASVTGCACCAYGPTAPTIECDGLYVNWCPDMSDPPGGYCEQFDCTPEGCTSVFGNQKSGASAMGYWEQGRCKDFGSKVWIWHCYKHIYEPPGPDYCRCDTTVPAYTSMDCPQGYMYDWTACGK